MSRNQRARQKEKEYKQRRKARLAGVSSSAIWNDACNRADKLVDQGLWSEAREVLEAVDRSHPNANCVLNRLARIYEELGETNCLALVNSRRKPNLISDDMPRQLIELNERIESDVHRLAKPDSSEVLLLHFRIDYDPVDTPRDPQVQEWFEEACSAIHQNKGREAEALLKKCIEVGGEAPDLMNNLAAALSMQGRDQEAQDLGRAIHANWPDYFFGRIFMANMASLEKRFGVAEQILRPMLQQERFHITEFRAMVIAFIQLQIAQSQYDAAQRWVDVWRTIEPDHDDVRVFQRKISELSSGQSLLSLLAKLTGLRR